MEYELGLLVGGFIFAGVGLIALSSGEELGGILVIIGLVLGIFGVIGLADKINKKKR